jgi:hypothetical protein
MLSVNVMVTHDETPANVIAVVNKALKDAGLRAKFVSDGKDNVDAFEMYTLLVDGKDGVDHVKNAIRISGVDLKLEPFDDREARLSRGNLDR